MHGVNQQEKTMDAWARVQLEGQSRGLAASGDFCLAIRGATGSLTPESAGGKPPVPAPGPEVSVPKRTGVAAQGRQGHPSRAGRWTYHRKNSSSKGNTFISDSVTGGMSADSADWEKKRRW